MKTVVLKFGGTSVGSIDRIKKVCKIIASYKKKKNKVVVISSAMGGVTNDLVNKSKLNGHRFYAFTDGLSESENENGQEIGIEGSIQVIEKNFNIDVKKQLSEITKDVIKAAGNNKLSDDLTLISIGR